MYNATFFGNFDVTSLILSVFVLFFVGLIIYLRREDRREGYPLEQEASGKLEPGGGLFFTAKPKTFILAHDQGLLLKPNIQRESQAVNARPTSRAPGSPLQPTGDPMMAGVGPGAFAQRARKPELTFHGATKIVPLRVATEFVVDTGTADPRGMTVIGVDGVAGGVVSDVWVDRSEYMVRYLEVAVTPVEGAAPAAIKTVLVPMTMVVIHKSAKTVKVDAITGAQFAQAPVLENPDQITLYEEERVTAYYGGGYLYATPSRSEPWL
jgi:photosynthetic reaction center H subunit